MSSSIALIGNPNCGKTTLFNVLTSAHQKVGNWPGVTVEKKTGTLTIDGQSVEIVDLPGIYNLEQTHVGIDERIAQDALDQGDYSLIINILDASNLERNLILTQQLLEKQLPVIVALNMLDVAEQQGLHINADELAGRLQVPVIPIVASRKQGVNGLLESISEHLGVDLLSPPETPDPVTPGDLPARYMKVQRMLDGVVTVESHRQPFTEKIDTWVLNRYLGIPVFLLMMYLMFTFAVNVGAVFIDFFDIVFASLFIDGTRYLLDLIHSPAWLTTLLADGLGGGVTLVATFIPVIGFLYLCLSALEDSGYMSRAAFVVDRLMARIGLPGNAFVPLIVGFGCNVPAVMASRSLSRDSDRLMTIAMAPFMSCGARLTVYTLFAAAFFPTNGQNIVFLLYLLGIALAVGTGWIFRRQLFPGEVTRSVQEMPAYHMPVMRNIFITTWFRLRGFALRAGKNIVAVVVVLSMLNSISTDGTFGHEDSQDSVLAAIGRTITPAFSPLGISEDNWPATVGLFTGMFAKEAIVGTLDALYSEPVNNDAGTAEAPDIVGAFSEAITSIGTAAKDLSGALIDPLGIGGVGSEDAASVAESQGVKTATLTNMAALFGTAFAAFSYLVFILLYAPCVAVLGAVVKEAGWRYALIVFSWSTGLAYYIAALIYQAGSLNTTPLFSSIWIIASTIAMAAGIFSLKRFGKKAVSPHLINVVQIG
ncbi:Fe(2+) transporter permease subunit FeoB [Aurantivibrio plasticivorans]